MKTWSEYTLFKSFKQRLIDVSKSENRSLSHSGFYYGAISTAVKIFKSYFEKHEKREAEILMAKEQFIITNGKINNLNDEMRQVKIKIKKGSFLNKDLAKMENQKVKLEHDLKQYRRIAERKHVSFPIFRGNEVYFGRQGMFEFIKEENEYILLISDYRALRQKIRLSVKIGDLRKIHKKCKREVEIKETLLYCNYCKTFVPKDECKINYQEHFIQKCIDKDEHRIVYPKIIKRGNEFYFILPARDGINVKSKEEIEKWIKKDKDIDFCCLSFGIKKPITLSAIKNGKIKTIKTFGDGSLYQKGEVERRIRANIFNGIGERYKHNHPHNKDDKKQHQKKRKALKKANEKMGFRHQRFCNYYNQKLTHDVVQFIKANFEKPLVILRDMKNIKEISYRGDLMRTLTRWSVQQQNTFLEYKLYLNGVPIYKLPYKDLKTLKCWRCGKEQKEKLTTLIVKHEKLFECEECKATYNLHIVVNHNLFQKLKGAIA